MPRWGSCLALRSAAAAAGAPPPPPKASHSSDPGQGLSPSLLGCGAATQAPRQGSLPKGALNDERGRAGGGRAASKDTCGCPRAPAALLPPPGSAASRPGRAAPPQKGAPRQSLVNPDVLCRQGTLEAGSTARQLGSSRAHAMPLAARISSLRRHEGLGVYAVA